MPEVRRRGLQGDKGFLKGLIVVDDVAYFGRSPPMLRQHRDGPLVQCDLLAVDLVRKQLVAVHKVDTHGLLNILSAPQLSADSTFIAQRSNSAPPRGQAKLDPRAPGVLDPHAIEAARQQDGAASSHRQSDADMVWSEAWSKVPAPTRHIAGRWHTGMPYMDLARKGTQPSEGAESTRDEGDNFRTPSRSNDRLRQELHQPRLRRPSWPAARQLPAHRDRSRQPTYLHLGVAPGALLGPLQVRCQVVNSIAECRNHMLVETTQNMLQIRLRNNT